MVSNISSDGILINWAVLLVLSSVLTIVQVQQEETAKDLIQAVTAVFMASAAHICFTFQKKSASVCFASPQLCSRLLPTPRPLFLFLTYIYIFSNSLCLTPRLLFHFPFHYPALLWSLPLLFQTHCSQTLSSPHVNPSLPSSVAHNSIPIGSYIF